MFRNLALEVSMVGKTECKSCNTKGEKPNICQLSCGIGLDISHTHSNNRMSIFYLKLESFKAKLLCDISLIKNCRQH